AEMSQPAGGIAAPLFQLTKLGWTQVGYNNEATTPIDRNSAAFRAIATEHPVIAEMSNRTDPVIFKAGETWYRLAPPETSAP
ncbi:MAG: hypothetical protein WD873_00365, partial [Candidatus Hydrogenedentales bacterium]